MSSSEPTTAPEPMLRALPPALRALEKQIRAWLDGPHRYPLSPETRIKLENLGQDLRRQADALDVDKPILIIVLMGGTGVGKSTFLNALAGGKIAQASIARPTTRDPVVYYHESVRTDRLDPALQLCRLAPHDRPALEQKVIVDTPDLDSNDLANREKLYRLLPVADVILYVGSQEKYHDRQGWELFLQQRQRRAFAFVLNKWDRCLHGLSSGVRPDEDLLHDLKSEGFQNPLLFRVCSQYWVDRATAQPDGSLPEGEQFPDLVEWLEQGLSSLEIAAIKTRGVGQLLQHLEQALQDASPPPLDEPARRARAAWESGLREEAAVAAEALLNTLEPYQKEVEHHFALQGQRRFRGMMAGYLQLITRIRYLGSQLRERFPLLPRGRGTEHQASWDLASFTEACSEVAADRSLDGRARALANRLLIQADEQGFPLQLLQEPVEAVAAISWRHRYAQALSEVLQRVEAEWARPTGWRRWVQAGVVFLADWVPLVVLLATCGILLWEYLVEKVPFALDQLLLPAVVVVLTLVVLHVLITVLMPLRWAAIRGEFQRRLQERLRTELEAAYGPVPEDVAKALAEERQHVDKLLQDTRHISDWIRQREQALTVSGLYGS